MINIEDLKRLKEDLGLDYMPEIIQSKDLIEVYEIDYNSDDKNTSAIQIIYNNDTVEEFLVGDFRKQNDIKSFKRLYFEKYNEKEFSPFFIFNTWEDRMKKYYNDYNDCDAKGKRQLKNLFDSAAFFYGGESLIDIQLENYGENYLSYEIESQNEIKMNSIVYNISFYELQKIYNVSGDTLFDGNVRIGIQGYKSALLRNEFKNSIIKALLRLNVGGGKKSNMLREFISDKYSITECDEDDQFDYYYFRHNGVTIYYNNFEEIKINYNKMVVDAKKMNVINGAQTLTHMFNCFYEIWNDFNIFLSKEVDRKKIISDEDVNNMFSDLKKKGIVKTIFVNGPEDNMQSITKGLNTQIPIRAEDISYSSYDFKTLKNNLKKYKINLIRPGETFDLIGISYTLLELVKANCGIEFLPGSARNYNKQNIENDVKKIKNEITDSYAENLIAYKYIENWWKNNSEKNVYVDTDNKQVLSANGLYYFKSFYTKCLELGETTEIDNDSLEELYVDFLNTFDSIAGEDRIDSNKLKLNNLFKDYEKTKKKKLHEITELPDDYSEAIVELKKKILKSEYSINDNGTKKGIPKAINYLVLKRYCEENNLSLKNCRTITVNEEMKPYEHFSFDSSTFAELYSMENYPKPYQGNRISALNYSESTLHQRIHAKFHLFVFIVNKSDLKKVILLENFSFDILDEAAENAYNDVINGFIQGDTDCFPKSTNPIHIRPKAISGEDTFEFTNGDFEIKRTFWVNKEEVKKIIVNRLKK